MTQYDPTSCHKYLQNRNTALRIYCRYNAQEYLPFPSLRISISFAEITMATVRATWF
jgi:hypothetical protein